MALSSAPGAFRSLSLSFFRSRRHCRGNSTGIVDSFFDLGRRHSGLDAIARLWDLRSGRTSLVLSGHSRDILSIDFSSNGYQVATGSNDDTIRVWDIRNHKAIATIPGHRSAISDLKFFQAEKLPQSSSSSDQDEYPDTKVPRAFEDLEVFKDVSHDQVKKEDGDNEEDVDMNGSRGPGASGGGVGARARKPDFPVSGSFLVSSGYDGYVKVWSADDWQQVRSLSNDASGKVMSCDVSSGAFFPPIPSSLSLSLYPRRQKSARSSSDSP